ncbi:MAG: glutamate synthase subunit beta [Pseudomonadota bacterium]
MSEVQGILKIDRKTPEKELPQLRLRHSKEFTTRLSRQHLAEQGSRCMDCGVPFCHNACPLGNVIPEWNQLTSEEDYRSALEALLATNNFPEFTGRICPAPCETACVLGLNEDPVSIEAIEMSLADLGFEKGWIRAQPPQLRTGRKVAVVGSGPAGLAAAQQLNRAGHLVTVFERAEKPGGLLMYGIPEFKLDKTRVARRIDLLKEEGILFRCGVHVGVDVTMAEMGEDFDATILACGAAKKRDVQIPGRESKGIYFAEQFLTSAVIWGSSGQALDGLKISAAGKDVVVIGGGDTGSDCLGTSLRQGAKSVTQFEIMPKPPELSKHPRHFERPSETPWPEWTYMLRTSTSHEEGGKRAWAHESVAFERDAQGQLTALITRELSWNKDSHGRWIHEVIPNSDRRWPCDLALVAVGFVGPEIEGPISELGIELGERGNIKADEIHYATNIPGVFAAGDVRRGQSLVVWAIAEGRRVAQSVERYLQSN